MNYLHLFYLTKDQIQSPGSIASRFVKIIFILASFFRLFLSSLAYEKFLLLKKSIKKTTFAKVKKWQITTIKAQLLKIGATIRITKKQIYYQLSKAFAHQELFREMITK
jgi:hypothetical protein